MKIPKTPKGVANRLATLALKRLALQDQIDAIAAQERELLTEGVFVFRREETASVQLEGIGTVTRTTQPIATVHDWEKVFRYAADHPDAGVVHKRTSPTAIEKLAFRKETVPGVELDHREVLVVNVRAGRKKA